VECVGTIKCKVAAAVTPDLHQPVNPHPAQTATSAAALDWANTYIRALLDPSTYIHHNPHFEVGILQELSPTSSPAIPEFDDDEQAIVVRSLECSSSHSPEEYIIFDTLKTKHSDLDAPSVHGPDELSNRHPPQVCASPRKAPSTGSGSYQLDRQFCARPLWRSSSDRIISSSASQPGNPSGC
jgi:hypothetical protein